MQILENVPLKDHTTFHLGGPARFFAECKIQEELIEALHFAREKNIPVFIIGGGSNILVSDEGFPGLVLKVELLGKEILEETGDHVRLRVASGELLDPIIGYTVENGWWGMENLSFVPGFAGGLAIQNVGAYGAEASNAIESVEVYDRNSATTKQLSNAECEFAYRKSIFNSREKGRYVVLAVTLKLSKTGVPDISYTDVARWFAEREIPSPSISEVREAIIAIRKRKGQDPSQYWSAGSFFKNPRLLPSDYEKVHATIEKNLGGDAVRALDELLQKIKPRRGEEALLKIPAAFILDKLLGLRGMQEGGAKLSELQVINITNIGSATTKDVVTLFEKVCSLAKEKTGITLEHEPEFVGIPD